MLPSPQKPATRWHRMKYSILPSIITYLRAAVTPGSPPPRKPGRPPFARSSMFCAFVCKALLGFPSENALHQELTRNPSLRELCGFFTVPSVQTLNRFRARRHRLIESVFKKLADRFTHVYELVAHLAMDSTPIPVQKADLDARKGYGTRGWFYGYKYMFWQIVRRNYRSGPWSPAGIIMTPLSSPGSSKPKGIPRGGMSWRMRAMIRKRILRRYGIVEPNRWCS